MTTTGIRDEDFLDYKEPSMFISSAYCSFKCEIESGVNCCQNRDVNLTKRIRIDDKELIERYLSNPITHAVVIGGLEPFDQLSELCKFIRALREDYHCDDTVVIYTGYDEREILSALEDLKQYRNIIVKFGRFLPDRRSRFDEVLGVTLASPNQYAERIS